ncbi:DinB family protein [Pseudovibrio sp. SPO723]|uniref:DinB family protein n=1 Tax=Nesiotobacter zosterae TaxID=392721 RepID=UPI0029C35E4D|nr:DinB family protein [Pseudovibrio sp. SPO723]MDX5594749.1 DinB family protein [Pseudovibrio sp. SPO723]
MPTPHDLALMARYNRWMNEKIYTAANTLTAEEIEKDRGAYFKSILGTLNHVYVADIIWLQRFSEHPAHFSALAPLAKRAKPSSLDMVLYDRLPDLWEARVQMDSTITKFTSEITQFDLNQTLTYKNMAGIPMTKPFSDLLQHFFNHQTHHRGQVSTLLLQAGKDIGVTDLLALIDNV